MSLRAVASGGGGGGGGTGDVVGPASSTLNAIARYADTTGKLLKNSSGATMSDNFALTLAGATVTASEPVLNLTQTWNNGGVVFTGARINVTNTASAAGSLLFDVQVGGATAFNVTRTGAVAMPGNINMGAGATNPQAILNGGTVTASTPVLSVSQTWNNSGVTFTGALINITDTASAATSKLFATQVGGSDRSLVVLVGTSGRTLTVEGALTSSGTYAGNNYALSISQSAGAVSKILMEVGGGVAVASDRVFSWTSGAATGTKDILLYRDAAGTLAQRNGTSAQIHRIYYTYTDASNYSRLAFNTAAASLEIAAETAGTGADDIDLRLTPSTTTAAVDFRNPANGAGAGAGTITNAPSAGNPAYWLKIKIAGTVHYIPAWT